MKRKELVDILERQLDGLLKGVDQSDLLLAQYPAEQETLVPLFSLAQLLCRVLVPVEPQTEFVAALGEELDLYDRPGFPNRACVTTTAPDSYCRRCSRRLHCLGGRNRLVDASLAAAAQHSADRSVVGQPRRRHDST